MSGNDKVLKPPNIPRSDNSFVSATRLAVVWELI